MITTYSVLGQGDFALVPVYRSGFDVVLVFLPGSEDKSATKARVSFQAGTVSLGSIKTSASMNKHNDKEVSHSDFDGLLVAVPDQLVGAGPPGGWTEELLWYLDLTGGASLQQWIGRFDTQEFADFRSQIQGWYDESPVKQLKDSIVLPLILSNRIMNVVGVFRMTNRASFTYNVRTYSWHHYVLKIDASGSMRAEAVTVSFSLRQLSIHAWELTVPESRSTRTYFFGTMASELVTLLYQITGYEPETYPVFQREINRLPLVDTETTTPIRGRHYDGYTLELQGKKLFRRYYRYRRSVWCFYSDPELEIEDFRPVQTIRIDVSNPTYATASANFSALRSSSMVTDWYGKARNLVSDELRRELSENTLENFRYLTINSTAYLHDLIKIRDMVSPLMKLKANPRSWENWANAWLTYRYGIRLFIMDTLDIVKGWKRAMKSSAIMGKGRAQLVPEEPMVVDGVLCNLQFHQKAYYETSKSLLGFIRQVIRIVDLWPSAVNVWDFIPYSFVLDWFVKVGDVLQRMDQYTDLEIFPIESVLYSAKCTEVTYVKVRYPALTGNIQRRSYERWIEKELTLDFSTTPTTSLPGTIQCVDGLALVVQRQRDLNRLLRRARRYLRRRRRNR